MTKKKLKIKWFCTILCCTIGLKASPHLSLNQNQLWHVHTHFPFLHLSYKYLLPIFIGSIYTRCLFWLAWEVTVTLVLILRHSIENHALYWCQDNYDKMLSTLSLSDFFLSGQHSWCDKKCWILWCCQWWRHDNRTFEAPG